MLTIAQIYAVVALLLAFNVPQATVSNVQTILQNATPIVQTMTTENVGGTIAPTETTPITVFTFKYEDSLKDYYYAGNKEIVSVTIDGAAATTSLSRHIPDCINITDGSGQITDKICGYWVARIPAKQGQSIQLTAADGSTYSQ